MKNVLGKYEGAEWIVLKIGGLAHILSLEKMKTLCGISTVGLPEMPRQGEGTCKKCSNAAN